MIQKHTHLGQLTQVTDDAGTRTIGYNQYGEQETDALLAGGTTHLITETQDAMGRSTGFTYAKNSTLQHTVTTGYSSDGRIKSAGFLHGGAEKQFGYAYQPGSNLLHTLTMPCNMTLTQSYETQRDLLTGMAYRRGSTLVAQRTYTYDSHGRRATKKVTTNGSISLHQRYLYRGYLQLACCDLTRTGHPCLWFITWDPTQSTATRPLAIRKDGTWYAYGWDLTKNICEVFGPAGYIRTAYSYAPYGEVDTSGDVTQPIQWSSEYHDTELGLIYYNYRHYNPVDGRWMGRDLVKTSLHNEYNFIGNNVYADNDYLGEFGILGAAIGAIMGAAVSGTIAAITGERILPAIAGGAAGGAIVGSGVGIVSGMLYGAASGAIASIAEDIVINHQNNESLDNINYEKLGYNAFTGAALGGVGNIIRPCVANGVACICRPHLWGKTTKVYRGVGVFGGEKMLANAKQGIAKAHKPFSGHANANLHNRKSQKSQMISVTTDRDIALSFVQGEGVILSKDVPAWSLFKSPDLYNENEKLLIGSQRDFQVEKVYNNSRIEQLFKYKTALYNPNKL